MRGVAIISGATGGIGLSVVQACWERGYGVLALGRTPQKCDKLREWFHLHPRTGQHFSVLPLDLGATDDFWPLQDRLQQAHVPVTLFAACHGVRPTPCPALTATSVVRRVWEVDVMGTLQLCQVIGRTMLVQRQGSIVLVSSIHSQATYPHRVPYSMAKAAVLGLVRALAVEWGPYNVTVNAVVPWQSEGERTEAVIAQEGPDTRERYLQRSPLRRLVTPDDIAQAVLFLAENRSMSGAEVVLDCGVRASLWHRPFEGDAA